MSQNTVLPKSRSDVSWQNATRRMKNASVWGSPGRNGAECLFRGSAGGSWATDQCVVKGGPSSLITDIGPYQTCSMPWGVLSLNVNCGKTWWSMVLLRIVPIVHAMMFYMTGDFFDKMICEPREKRQKPTRILDTGFCGICTILNIFSWNFGLLKDRIESDVWEGINGRSYNRNKWYIFLILASIWNQRKRLLGSWHMSAF